MINYYIHQIGNINDKRTYERLINILKSKAICSRGFLEKEGINFEYGNPSFKLDIPEDKNGCIMMKIFTKIEYRYLIRKIDL